MSKRRKNSQPPTPAQPELEVLTLPEIITVNEPVQGSRNLVTKSNKLIMSYSKLSLNEQKLLATMISRLNPMGDLPEGQMVKVTLHAREISELTGIKLSNIYRFIDNAAYNFHKIPIETPGKKAGAISYINIAHKSEFDPETRLFWITFHPDVLPELIALKREFTTYNLKHFVNLSSKYSLRLYELVKKGPNPVTYKLWDVDNLSNSLYWCLGLRDHEGTDIVASYTSSFHDFRKRVLDPSVADIAENTDIDISYEQITRGRAVYAIRFSYKSRKDDPSLIDRMVDLGISLRIAEKILSESTPDLVERNLKLFVEKSESGTEIKSPVGYLKYLIQHDVANLPDVASPYSLRYQADRDAQLFVTQFLMPIWWRLPEAVRDHISTLGLTGEPELDFAFTTFKKSPMEAASWFNPDDFISELIESCKRINPEVVLI